MKKTAIDELLSWMQDNLYFIGNDLLEAVKECKEIEKQQIIEAHGDKKKLKSNSGSCVTYAYTYTGEMYFNDNFNTNK